jgi:hypothetical protein
MNTQLLRCPVRNENLITPKISRARNYSLLLMKLATSVKKLVKGKSRLSRTHAGTTPITFVACSSMTMMRELTFHPRMFVNFQFTVESTLASRAANNEAVNLPLVAARVIIESSIERSVHLQLLARQLELHSRNPTSLPLLS